MSKTTIAIVAAVSAAAGAGAVAALSSRPDRKTVPVATSNSTTPTSYPRPLKELIRPVEPNGLFQYGFPGPKVDLHPTLSTTSAFDRRTRNPFWVVEHITPDSLSANNADRRHSYFVEDHTIPEKFQAKLHDYQRSGYDRGHQVPAADAKWSQDALDQTFLLSNMCPQVGDGFNRDYWAHFEDFCRRLTNDYPSVRIVTGPLYLPKRDPMDGKYKVSYEVIGNPPNVSVPTHFFKVIFAEDGKTGGNVSLGAFVLPNAPIANDKPLTEFEAPIEAIEKASGLEFATNLPIQRRRKLCKEVHCTVIVRDYADRHKNLMGSSPDKKALPQSEVLGSRSNGSNY